MTPDSDAQQTRTFASDPRADQRLIQALSEFGMHEAQPVQAIKHTDSESARLAWLIEAEKGFEALLAAQVMGLEPAREVDREIQNIVGTDGTCIRLHVHSPRNPVEPARAVLHVHGGGMTMLSSTNPLYVYFRDAIASRGFTVVGVEFRNAAGNLGPHPFPAGLTDIYSSLNWLSSRPQGMGFESIVLVGESGGANLAIACGLLDAQRNSPRLVDGVYALCPMLVDARQPPDETIVSHTENADYFISKTILQMCAASYDPVGVHRKNPLCWPLEASLDDLRALPPHVISVNELDPLRDEGLQFFERLVLAGVEARQRLVRGTCHAGDCNFPNATNDTFWTTISDIVDFVQSLPSRAPI